MIKKVPVEKESALSMGGTIIFLALFPQNYNTLRAALSLLFLASTVNDVRRKLHMVKIQYCRKTSKKNARYYRRDYWYSNGQSMSGWQMAEIKEMTRCLIKIAVK